MICHTGPYDRIVFAGSRFTTGLGNDESPYPENKLAPFRPPWYETYCEISTIFTLESLMQS